MRTKLPLAILTCILFSVVNSGWAASIGGSFLGRGASPANILNPAETAGVVPQANWNNIDSGEPTGGQLDGTSLAQIDDVGNFTAVKVIYDCNDSWNSDGGTATPDEKLMKGIIKANPDPDLAPANNSERMVFVLTNLSAAGTYDVIVYTTANGGNAKMDLSVGTVTNYILEQNNFTTGGGFVPATSTTPGVYDFASYAGFTNVTPALDGTITIIAKKFIEDPQINDGIGVAGIQVVRVSGPAFPPNTDPCSITANPASPGFAVDGGTATFTVGTAGPRKIQWTKNNVPIPGAINSTLVYTAALADDGAQIRAVVYNNVITNTSTPATLFVDPAAPPVLTQGFLKAERWEGITGTGVDVLKTAIAGGPPTTTYFVAGAGTPDAGIDNFGVRLSGWIKPDVSGEYDFFLRSDDSSELYLNSVNPGAGTNTLPDITVDFPIAQEVTCCEPFKEPPAAETTATPIYLEAGKLYGIVILYKDGTGGDMVQVAMRLTNSPPPAASLKPIAPHNTWALASGAGTRAEISAQPVSKTVFEGRTASFNFAVSTIPVAGVYGVQWFTNGSVLAGATTPLYTTPPTILAQNNTQFRAVGYTLRGPLTSSIATLTVLADTNPPVPAAGAITRAADSAIQVGVGFDEAVNTNDLVPANFTVIGAATSTPTFPTNSFGDYKGVLIDTTGLVPGNTYTARVSNVRDLKGNAISASGVDAPFTVGQAGWADSGSPMRPGQVVPVGANGFDILNGGRGEWGTYDEITIAYLKKTNDFDVKVQVVYAEPGSQWTRVGLQARNNLNIGQSADDRNSATGTASAYAQTHVNPNQTIWQAERNTAGLTPANPNSNNGHEQNQRLAIGIATSGWGSGVAGVPVYPDVWLRLRRSGATIEGFRGEDGVNWISQGTTSLTDQQADMFVGPML